MHITVAQNMSIKFESKLMLLMKNLLVFLTILKEIWLLMMFGLVTVLITPCIKVVRYFLWWVLILSPYNFTKRWSARADVLHDKCRSNGTQSSTSKTLSCCPKAWDHPLLLLLPCSPSNDHRLPAFITTLTLILQHGLPVPRAVTWKEKWPCDCTHSFSFHLDKDKFSTSSLMCLVPEQ